MKLDSELLFSEEEKITEGGSPIPIALFKFWLNIMIFLRRQKWWVFGEGPKMQNIVFFAYRAFPNGGGSAVLDFPT